MSMRGISPWPAGVSTNLSLRTDSGWALLPASLMHFRAWRFIRPPPATCTRQPSFLASAESLRKRLSMVMAPYEDRSSWVDLGRTLRYGSG